MSADTVYVPKADAFAAEAAAPQYPPADEAGLAPLARIASEAGLASVLPKLQVAFASVYEPGANLLEMLASNINELQDGFIRALYAELSRLRVDLSIKITLRLDSTARLTLVGEHPDQAAIRGILADQTALSTAFSEIAAQSAALRGLRSLSTMLVHADATESYAALSSSPGENSYQICLKGDMNHFYFCRA